MSSLTIILPFFNEEGWIDKTVQTLAIQSDIRFRLLLIDNGSTDNGTEQAREAARSLGSRAEILSCPTPGKIHAMALGLSRVETAFVAICDADTEYPIDYVKRILDLFTGDPEAASVMAIDLYAPLESAESRKRTDFILRKSRRFSAKCHAGGYAQAYRTDALRAAGGFDAKRWPYVLEDHEIVHRVMTHGRAIYDRDHVCFPSARRSCRKAVSWTRAERLIYRYTPRFALDWYFYTFLGRRLAARNGTGDALRMKDWPAQRP
ncbi:MULTISPECIES: glycosyltransferase [Sphingobium]|jgi:glycosyltransferase involved in cell wall biosynthesis|uniref:Glycosyl transferase n=2 Tax=Sphingobium TaxID=165695 RepID=A0A085K4L4_SPHYA|nr:MULTISPECIES: glycosyltransferase family A protein [Sphingobium]KEZ14393.1 putative Glycosyl transferase [Sphingobium yanoikuyae]KFD27660.1 glycosyl transferase [Sphingobium yanoikuyae]KZC75389.1 glycosyl transferase [Sphingobium yanoikuyae]MDG2513907.1 glycosyltransferase family A protein [Sphingobium yanoikuyae]MDV3481522.1 glycosyltransferase family A protein [Sphingobium yanoikuyae]|tara:strand:- start:3479 stop:4267 length:789 start_codon:yes stop_codon:yes gene_type:complete